MGERLLGRLFEPNALDNDRKHLSERPLCIASEPVAGGIPLVPGMSANPNQRNFDIGANLVENADESTDDCRSASSVCGCAGESTIIGINADVSESMLRGESNSFKNAPPFEGGDVAAISEDAPGNLGDEPSAPI